MVYCKCTIKLSISSSKTVFSNFENIISGSMYMLQKNHMKYQRSRKGYKNDPEGRRLTRRD